VVVVVVLAVDDVVVSVLIEAALVDVSLVDDADVDVADKELTATPDGFIAGIVIKAMNQVIPPSLVVISE
jgi:hypothetical protein